MNKRLIKLQNKLKNVSALIADIRLDAIKDKNKKIEIDCQLIFNCNESVLHYVTNMINNFQK